MRVYHEGKRDGVRDHHERKSNGVRDHHERKFIMEKSDGVRVHRKEEQWDESTPLEKERWGES